MKKRILSIVLLLSIITSFIAALPITVSADTSGICGANLTWSIDSGTLTVSGSGAMSDYSWESAPWYTTENIENVKSIVINNGVTTIGDSAFYGFNQCISVVMPNSLLSIGEYAFMDCIALKSITIPDKVTEIGQNAFYDCTDLESIQLSENLEKIGDWCFYNCINLKNISLPDKITLLETRTFLNCKNLTYISLPESLVSIEAFVFDGTGITEITIPKTVTSLCEREYLSGKSGKYSAFHGCDSLKTVIFEAGIETIPEFALANSSVETIFIPDTVKEIETNAFYNCVNIKNIFYGGNATDWENIAISSGNTSLTSVKIHCNCQYDSNIFEDIDNADYAIKKAATLMDNYYYNLCKSEKHPHNIFAEELGDANLCSFYYTITEDIVNLKSTNFYTIVLYEALFENKKTEHITQTIDDIINENCSTKFVMLCNSAFSSAFDEHYYLTSEFLDKEINVNEETLIKCGMASEFTNDIGDAFEIISFAGKTYRTLYESCQKAYTLSLVSDTYIEILNMLKEETNDADMIEAIELLIKDINYGYTQMITEDLIKYSRDTILNYAKDTVIDCIGSKIPVVLLYKYAFDLGKIVSDGVYNANDISKDVLCIRSIDVVDNCFKKLLSKAENLFKTFPCNVTANRLTTIADCYKSIILYGCDVSDSMVKNCATGGIKAKIFGSDENYINVSNSICNIKQCYESYDFYSELNNEQINNADELKEKINDFTNNSNNHVSPSAKEELYIELNEYNDEYKKVTDVSLNYNQINLEKGDTFKLAASIAPNDATDTSVMWISSNENVAKVNNGVVTAINHGITTIKAISNSSIYYDVCTVNVLADDICVEYSFTETESGTKQLNFSTSNIPENAVLIIAGYDKDMELIKYIFSDINSQLTINLLSKDVSVIKYFIWNNLKDMTPLYKTEIITIP